MAVTFVLAWAAVLAALAVLPLVWRTAPSGVEALRQGALTLAVVSLSAWALGATAAGRGAGFEVLGYAFQAEDVPVTLGTDPRNDVVLLDGYAAPFHVALRFVDGPGGPALAARSLTADRRLERGGVDIHHAELRPGSAVVLDGETLEVVAAGGLLPSITVDGEEGRRVLRPPFARRLAAAFPVVGPRVEVSVGRLEPGFGARVLPSDLPRGDRPVAELALRGRTALLRFPGPADRAAHPVAVRHPGDVRPVRPADREALLRHGDSLTLGYSRYLLDLDPSGRAELRVVRGGARYPLPAGGDGLWRLGGGTGARGQALPWAVAAPVPVLFQAGEAGALRLASADPDRRFASVRGELRLEPGQGPRTADLAPGEKGVLRLVSPRSEVALRLRGPERPLALALGADPTDPGTRRWRALLGLGAVYVLGAMALGARGVLRPASGTFLHGLMLAFGQGLAALSQLSVPGDPRLGGFVDKQAAFGAAGLLAVVVGLLLLTVPRFGSDRRPHPFQRLGAPLAGARAPRGRAFALAAQPRVWLVWALACLLLLVQVPFGEQGVALPGLGSVQPVEATKTCLLVFLSFFTVRALEDKALRAAGRTEGPLLRWGYMVHALPLLAIVVLCFGLDDISPILIFGLFLLLMYYLSLSRPELRFWPPRRLLSNFAVEQAVLLLVLPTAAVWLLLHHGGTVGRRFQVWQDPFLHTGGAEQFVTSLWNLTSAGLFGAGWGGRNGLLPPAVQDDFALTLVAAHTGLVGVVLLVATYVIALGAGLVAAAGVASQRRDLPPDGTRERVQLLAVSAVLLIAIQVVVVLSSVTGQMPVMGQPLPFVAAGGSHLVLFCFPAVFFVLSAGRRGRESRP